ncbi:hypothetical protein [Flavobacterium sp. RSP15]|uniref:hypothetical protein n=1 Tax=Flavobacterium sp. RSP15 TaxID=2497485 RepID=UPI000F837AF6|nr:hypothetical protein [Flavobacterium sp. RSP15]RTY88190.1 hypothetical protein EKM00_03295 [Flavobacterium sp. RSP15]
MLRRQHFGLKTNSYRFTFWWKDKMGKDRFIQWKPFMDDTNDFEPNEKRFVQNFIVDDLERLL